MKAGSWLLGMWVTGLIFNVVWMGLLLYAAVHFMEKLW